MHSSAPLQRTMEYERAHRAMVTAAQVVRPNLAQADQGVVLLLDIVGMGHVNTQHGFLVGDRLLAEIETALQQEFCGRGCAARLAGDQFLVVLPHTISLEDAVRSARRAVGLARLPGRWPRRTAVQAHIGSARWNDDRSRRAVLRAASAELKATPAVGG